jgi:hypothetical protein
MLLPVAPAASLRPCATLSRAAHRASSFRHCEEPDGRRLPRVLAGDAISLSVYKTRFEPHPSHANREIASLRSQ